VTAARLSPVATTVPSQTRADQVYRAVRADLLTAHYQPGQWLKVSDLQKRFNASLSVIREALSRLVAEGLLGYLAQRGFRVVPLSLDDLLELTEARVKIETMVLRESLLDADATWEANLIAAHHLLERTQASDPANPGGLNPEWVPVHAQFHAALLAGCRNARLLSIANALRDNAELYRMWAPKPHRTPRRVATEHKKLMTLALARDVEACVSLLAQHIGMTGQALRENGPDAAP
jgi:DNA-binding GntR family transcriptional regulator